MSLWIKDVLAGFLLVAFAYFAFVLAFLVAGPY